MAELLAWRKWRLAVVVTMIGSFLAVLYQLIAYSQSNVSEQPLQPPLESALCLEVRDSHGTSKRRHRPSKGQQDCLLQQPADAYVQLLSTVMVGLPTGGRCNFENPSCAPPYLAYREDLRRFGDDWPPHGYTMIGKERLENFRAAISEVNRNQIPGALVETGVWRGGSMILAAALQKQSGGVHRELYLFDAFASFGGYSQHDGFLAVSLEQVRENFKLFGIFDGSNVPPIHFVKGLFNETTADWMNRTDPIAVLRVDGNFRASYEHVMHSMYENVPVGGIVIFDDVFHPHYRDVLQFWMQFKQAHGCPEELVRIDTGGGWFRKTKHVLISQRKF